VTLTTVRTPRLIPVREHLRSQYMLVVCTGLRKNNHSCHRTLGEININHPHDVRYTCRDCGSEYILYKP
jgi:hypothetical protein